MQITDYGIIPHVMKENLNRTHDMHITVHNSSCRGWNPNHYYLEAQRLAGRKYNMVITFLYVADDIISTRVDQFEPGQPDQPRRLRFPRNLSRAEITESILYPINDLLEMYSHLYCFCMLKSKNKGLRRKLSMNTYYFSDIFKWSNQQSECWDVTTDVCQAIHDTFADQDVPCIFVLLPAPYQVDDDILNHYARAFDIDLNSVDIRQPNRLLKNAFESRSLVLVDPLEYMREKAEHGRVLFGRIDGHLNRDGHKAVADFITPMVASFLPGAH
jgi:hypothetical protein